MTLQELRDLDARIHREVMGKHCEYGRRSEWDDAKTDEERRALDRYDWWNTFDGEPTSPRNYRRWCPVPRYTAEIIEAWCVIERLKGHFRCSISLSNKQVDWCWWVYVYAIDKDSPEVVIQEQSASLAICLAALKFVRGVQ